MIFHNVFKKQNHDDTNITPSGDSIQDVQSAVNSDMENLRKWLVATCK